MLIVDDHPGAREMLRDIVHGLDGFALVGEAASGEEALEAAAALEPRLVLMDRRMPGIDGLEAARRLRAQNGAIVVVLVSADDLPDHVVSEAGAASFINKHQLSGRRLLEAWQAHVM